MRVTVIGTGYVGTVTGACLAYFGHRVTCVDTDAQKIEKLRRGEMPIYEPHLEELLQLAAGRGGIDFTTKLTAPGAESDVIFIAVGTPPLETGEANLCYMEAAARSIGAAMDNRKFRVVVNKSTVPVGSGNLVETLVREGVRDAHPGNPRSIRFGVASNPEFLREGSAIADSLYPDRIVLGAEEEGTLQVLRELYHPLVVQGFEAPAFLPRPAGMGQVPVVTTTLTSAEMIKYAANAFLAVKIGFANEVANICERVGAEAPEVMAGIGLDARIGSRFLNPGLGWGGSCFGKDIQSLLHTAREYGYQSRLLEAALEVNRAQRQLVIQKLQGEAVYSQGPHYRPAGSGVQAGDRRPARRPQPADRRAAVANGRAGEGLRPDRRLPDAREAPIQGKTVNTRFLPQSLFSWITTLSTGMPFSTLSRGAALPGGGPAEENHRIGGWS